MAGCNATAAAVDLYLESMPLQFVVISVLLLLGGCFAGLTLGLMSLDPASLKILTKVPGGRRRARGGLAVWVFALGFWRGV